MRKLLFAVLITVTLVASEARVYASEFLELVESFLPVESMQRAGTWTYYLELKSEFSHELTESVSDNRAFLARLQHYWVDDFSGFARIIVDTVEDAHPIFILGSVAAEHGLTGLPVLPVDYLERRDEYLSVTSGYITRAEFVFATQRYLTMLQDGHMSGGFLMDGFTGGPFLAAGFIDVEWTYHDGGLYLPDGGRVLAIGGVPVPYVLEQIDRHYFAENNAARQFLYSVKSRYMSMVYMAGGRSGYDTINVLLDDGPLQYDIAMDFPAELLGEETDYIIDFYMIGDDIFYIDLRAFVDGPHIDYAVAAIEEAVAGGVRRFILDLRGNSGGNSFVGARLIYAMGGATTPTYGGMRRASGLFVEHIEWMLGSGIIHDETMFTMVEGMLQEIKAAYQGPGYIVSMPNPDSASNPAGVFISVLTDSATFSSARMTGIWVQDGNLGNIIGMPSRNSPVSFGEMMQVNIQDSFFGLATSTALWLRPSQDAVQDTLVPDILVEEGDALEVAVEFLINKRR